MDTANGTVVREDVVEYVAAMCRHAQESAALVGHFLTALRKLMGLRKPIQFPGPFLMELAAILRIRHWQSSAALAELAAEFEHHDELLDQMFRRFMDDPLQFCRPTTPEHCPLYHRVLQIWLRRCAWYGMAEVGTDVMVIDSVDDDELLAQMAMLLASLQRTLVVERGNL